MATLFQLPKKKEKLDYNRNSESKPWVIVAEEVTTDVQTSDVLCELITILEVVGSYSTIIDTKFVELSLMEKIL